MSAVRPEFGPTLPELLGPRWRALPRAVRIAPLAAAALLAAVLLWALVVRDDGGGRVTVREPVAFTFAYDAPLAQRPLRAGELARVGAGRQSLAVRKLELPPYRGDSAGFLPVYAVTLERGMAARHPGYLTRFEGRANVNRSTGYEIGFQYRDGARTMYGRRIVLLPGPTARQGLDLTLLSPRSRAVRSPSGVGRNDALRSALFSFTLGTDPK